MPDRGKRCILQDDRAQCGDVALATWQREGIVARAARAAAEATGAAFIYVNDRTGENAIIVYPGAAVGLSGQVMPSMRLKYLRDGVDDYDYVQLLKAQGQWEDLVRPWQRPADGDTHPPSKR